MTCPDSSHSIPVMNSYDFFDISDNWEPQVIAIIRRIRRICRICTIHISYCLAMLTLLLKKYLLPPFTLLYKRVVKTINSIFLITKDPLFSKTQNKSKNFVLALTETLYVHICYISYKKCERAKSEKSRSRGLSLDSFPVGELESWGLPLPLVYNIVCLFLFFFFCLSVCLFL